MAAFSGSFTERWVQHCPLPPRPKQKTYLERLKRGRSLVLVVSHGGTKSWRVIWYESAKPKSAKLGTYPDLSIADARKAADEFKPDKHVAKKEAGTVREVAAEFLKRYVDKKGLRGAREIRRQFDKHILPAWGETLIHDIRRRDVVALLDAIEDDHGPSMTNRVLATISKMMNWHVTRDDDYVSPIVKGMKKVENKPRDRHLNDDEIRALWTACEHEDVDRTYGTLLKFLLLTGQRRAKPRTMRWDDVNNGVWTISREEREKGAPSRLTLPQTAVSLLDSLPRIEGNPYVFAGRGKTAFNAWSQRKREIDKVLETLLPGMPHWSPHDLRRTCRGLMTRCRIETEIAERALGHSIKGIQSVYDKETEYGPRVDHALECVAAEIERILQGPAGDNVVPLQRS